MFNEVKDSGKRAEYQTGAVRDNQEGKGRYDLLPIYAIHRLARHFENGARKYGDSNWRKGIPYSRYIDSAKRHIDSYLMGNADEDHLIAAAWNLLCLVETQIMVDKNILPGELDDIYKFTGVISEQIKDVSNVS